MPNFTFAKRPWSSKDPLSARLERVFCVRCRHNSQIFGPPIALHPRIDFHKMLILTYTSNALYRHHIPIPYPSPATPYAFLAWRAVFARTKTVNYFFHVRLPSHSPVPSALLLMSRGHPLPMPFLRIERHNGHLPQPVPPMIPPSWKKKSKQSSQRAFFITSPPDFPPLSLPLGAPEDAPEGEFLSPLPLHMLEELLVEALPI